MSVAAAETSSPKKVECLSRLFLNFSISEMSKLADHGARSLAQTSAGKSPQKPPFLVTLSKLSLYTCFVDERDSPVEYQQDSMA